MPPAERAQYSAGPARLALHIQDSKSKIKNSRFLFNEGQKIQEKQNIFCPVSTPAKSPCHTRSGIVGIKLNFS